MLTLLLTLAGFLQPLMVVQDIELPDIQMDEHEQLTEDNAEEHSIIIEVDESPKVAAEKIETYHPDVEVVAIYTTLFQGLALKGAPKKVNAVKKLSFVKGTYPVKTYITLDNDRTLNPTKLSETIKMLASKSDVSFPSELNQTGFTGKGSKIGVIDTGIDFTHPDLKGNFKGGFDLVDLDDEPMETIESQGQPTLHGSHVSGIIAADGELEGVATGSDLYVYRALGPGGVGTSIQVIAALEEAVNDGMNIVNLSLGNTINGPDYPTSKAVNKAVKQGMMVVVANGNDGPQNWTVGAPATASRALSVGAYEKSKESPVLYEPNLKKKITLSHLIKTPPWKLEKDYRITEEVNQSGGKLFMTEPESETIVSKIKKAQKDQAVGVLLHLTDPADLEWRAALGDMDVTIPVALISKIDGNWIKANENEISFFKNRYMEIEEQVANFSSKGPVTVNWMMKPDVIAPGVNIVSTVPDGYEILNGTSMAAPHVAGALAVIKEAHPNWANDQIIGALKTTAHSMDNIDPTDQGAGLIDLSEAIKTDVIIYEPLLSFGKLNKHINERTIQVTVENLSDQSQQFNFKTPQKKIGQTWKLPPPFQIGPKEQRTIPVTLKLDSLRVDKDIVQGFLKLRGENQLYNLPYTAVGNNEDFPRVMGFQFTLDEAKEDYYKYSLYAAEEAKKLTIKLYDPDTLTDEGTLLETKEIKPGMNEGILRKSEVKHSGYYYGMILVENEKGETHTYETEIVIE